MTTNYIIHINNTVTNKRIRITELLSRSERKVLERNPGVFLYVLINLLYNLPFDTFRLVINGKYIFFKSRRKIDVVSAITKRLLLLNSYSIMGKQPALEGEPPVACLSSNSNSSTPSHSNSNSPSNQERQEQRGVAVVPAYLGARDNIVDDIIHQYLLMKLTNDNIMCIDNRCDQQSQEPFMQKRICADSEWAMDGAGAKLVSCPNGEGAESARLSLYKAISFFEERKNSLEQRKKMKAAHKELPVSRTVINRNKRGNKMEIAKKIMRLRIDRKEKKPSINIFDEFLDIHVLFRLGGGKGGFGANLRSKRRRKRRGKINIDASRNLRGDRIIVERLIKTAEAIIERRTKKETEAQAEGVKSEGGGDAKAVDQQNEQSSLAEEFINKCRSNLRDTVRSGIEKGLLSKGVSNKEIDKKRK